MSFFSDVKAVFSAFVDGCVDAAQENKKRENEQPKVERFDEVKVPDRVAKRSDEVELPDWMKEGVMKELKLTDHEMYVLNIALNIAKKHPFLQTRKCGESIESIREKLGKSVGK